MSDEIFFDGVRHISAGQAAQESGLTRDYIARLCKEGKLSGHRIGKNWYVDPRALQQFLVLKEHARAKRSEDLSQERIREYHGPNATAISTSDNRVPLYSPPRVFSAATAIPAAAQTVRKYDHPAGTTVSLPKTGSVGSGFERGNEIREKLAHALSASATQAKRLSDLPAGITHAALQGAHIPTYTLTPAMEFLHKVAALTLAVMLTFGTYAAVDPQYAHFAADSVSDSVASAIASTQHADQVASVAQTQFAAAAENPGGTLGSFFAFFPSAGEALAKAVNKNVNALVYSVAFPVDLVHSLGNVANVQRGEVAVQIEPYARALSHAALTQTNSTPVSAAPAPSHAVSSKNIPATVERIVETQRIVQAGGISEEELNLRLQQLDNKLSSQIASLAAANSTAIVGAYQAASYVAPSTSSSGSSFNGTTATLSVTGSATSTFAAGINISGGCFAVNGTCITGGGSGTPGGSDTQVQYNNNGAFAGSSGFTFSSSTKTLSITNASTTLLSVGNGSATTTIVGQATSTFGSGIQANAFNITGSATSTAANGFNLSAGCFAVNGTCISGGSSASSTLLVDHNTWSAIQLFNGGASSSQESVFTKFYAGGTATTTIDSAGNLAVGGTLTAYASSTIGAGGQTTGLTIFGGATTTGNAYFAGNVGVNTTAPTHLFQVGTPNNSASSNDIATFASSNYGYLSLNGTNGSSNVGVGFNQGSSGGTVGNNFLALGIVGTQGDSTYGLDTTHSGKSNGDIVLQTYYSATFHPILTAPVGTNNAIFDGNVGIGTTTPWKRLSVAGDIIGTNITATGTLAVAGLASFTAGASTTNASNFGTAYFGGSATTTIDSAGNLAFGGNVSGAGLISCSGTFDKVTYNSTTKQFGCSADQTSGGGAGVWATTTNSLAIYPSNTSYVVLVGTNATTTTGNILEVAGNSLLRGNLSITGNASTTLFSSLGKAYFGSTATSSFDTTGALTLAGISNSLLAADNTGKVIASTTIGTNLLTGTLATVNTTAITAGGTFTITAASSTLLANNNTFSGSNIFSSLLNLTGGASTTQLSVFAKAYFGGSATSSFNSNGLLDIANQTTATSSLVTVGSRAFLTASSSAFNTGLGFDSLSRITNGTDNTALGYQANLFATSSFDNTAIGYQALMGQGNAYQSGSFNAAVGSQALLNNSTGQDNIAFGYLSLANNTTGNSNIGIGSRALENNVVNSGNVGVGYKALDQLGVSGAGGNNTALGYQAGYNIRGYSNIWIGDVINTGSGYSGGNNIGIGSNLSFASQSASNQLNLGGLIFGTLPATSTAWLLPTSGTIGIGTTSPTSKFGIAANNGDTLTTLFQISSSTASATTTLFSVSNTGILNLNPARNTGDQIALFGGTSFITASSTGFNTGLGASALSAITGGSYNSALGYQALGSNTSGVDNTAIGENALFVNTAGKQNTSIGGLALYNATGGNNVGLGFQAGYSVSGGYGNILLGAHVSANNVITSGSGNIGLGNELYFPSVTASNQLNLGGLIFGTLPATSTAWLLPTSGTIGIGTTSPTSKFGIAANNGDTLTTLFQISSSTASATTSLFSISNTGAITQNGITSSLISADNTGKLIASTTIGTNLLSANTISGVALGGTLANHSHNATLSGTSYNGSAAISDWGLNLANANSWTGLQQFTNASTTLFSSFGPAYFGSTATSSFGTNGALTLVNALTYGGVTLSNSVTGSGSMVLSTSPTFTGQANFNTTAVTSYTTYGSTAGYIGDAGQFLTGVNTNSLGLKSQGTLYLSANASASPIAFLTSTGFGVGTTSPQAKIEASDNSSASTTPLYISNFGSATSSTKVSIAFRTDDITHSTGTTTASIFSVFQGGTGGVPQTANGDLAFSTLRSGTLTEGARLTSAGNFGIGTTSPSGTLGILGSGSGKVLSVFGASNTNDGILLQAGGGSSASTGGDVELYGGQASNSGVGGSLYLAPGSSSNIPGDIFLLTNKAGTNSGQRVHINTNLTGSNMFGTFNVNGSVAIGSFSSTAIPPTNGLLVSGLGSFTNASSSLFSVFSKAYFGGTATTTIDSAGNLAVGGTLTAYASSTIGGGAQATGLTISGGATTTGNAYFAGNVSIGTPVPKTNFQLGPESNTGTHYTFYLAPWDTNSGYAQLVGNWASSQNWGIGPATGATDNTVEIGQVSNIGSGTWLGSQTLKLTVGGGLGIGTTSPTLGLLTISDNTANANTTAFLISSSTSNSTTTLFSIANTGSTTAANGINITAGCFSVGGACLSSGASLSAQNTWTALQLFSAGASTTQLSVFQKAYFGGTATTTIDSAGNIAGAGILTLNGTTGTTSIAAGQGFTIGSSQFLVQQGSGNVGIGNTSPAELLDILGSGYSKVKVTGNTAAAFYANTSVAGSKALALGAGSNGSVFTFDQSGYFAITADAKANLTNLGGTTNFFIDGASGHAGIGQIFSQSLIPSAVLEVGRATGGEAQRITTTGGNNAYLTFTQNGVPVSYLGFGGPGAIFTNALASSTALRSQYALHFGTNGDNIRMTIDTSGNVGIGTTSPYAKLSLQANQADTNSTLFAIASSSVYGGISTSTLLTFDNAGRLALGPGATPVSGAAQFSILAGTTTARQVSQNSLNGVGESIYIQGRYAYVADFASAGFEIWDISNPTAPVRMSLNTLNASAFKVVVKGRYAYIVNSGTTGGFEIWDVSNPVAPTRVGQGTLNTGGGSSLYIQGRYAYLADFATTNAFEVWDISNPYAPVRVSQSTLNGKGMDVSAQGRYVYIVDQTTTNGFEIWDVSNPAAPTRVSQGTLNQNGGTIYVQGRYAYLADNGLATNAFEIWDISNPASPSRVSQNTLNGNGGGVFVQGRYAYLADAATTNGFEIWDVSTPASPVRVSQSTNSQSGLGIFVQGRYAYFANNGSATNAFEIWDIGGGYVQQLEAGGIEAGTLSLRNNLAAVDAAFSGGLTVGQSLNITGSAGIVSGTSTIGTTANIFNIATASSSNSIFSVLGNGNIGIGTTTPFWNLTIASSSGPQLALTDTTAGSNAWTFRSISNSLFLATSTASATSTTAALAFNGTTGAATFGSPATTTFTGGLQTTALNITSSTASSTFANGIVISGGCVQVNGACITGGSGAQTNVQNTWTALQLFNAGASTTQLSVFQKFYAGGTATTTIDSSGNLAVGGTLTAYASSTIGGGTKTTGLTISGIATSTGGIIVTGNQTSSGNAGDAVLELKGASSHDWNIFALGSGHADPTAVLFYDATANKSPFTFNTSSWGLLAGYELGWSSQTQFADSGTPDVGISRNAAGVLEVNNGTAGQTTTSKLVLGNISISNTASTTLLSVFSNAYFGGSATSTFLSSGTLLVGTTTPSTSASLLVAATTSQAGSNLIFNVASSTGSSLFQINGNGNITQSGITNSLIAADNTGKLIASSTIGWNLLKGSPSSIFAFDNTGAAIATTSIGTNYLTGTLATINTTAITAGGSFTITAASSTLLSNNNTFSGSNTFSSLLNLTGGASTTQLSVFSKFYAGGTATTTIDSAGNVVVGGTLTSPTVIGGTSVSAHLSLESTSGVGTTDYINFLTNGGTTEAMRIVDSGAIGIGTTSPAAILDVYKSASGATADLAYWTNPNSATSTASRENFRALDVLGNGTTTAAITAILTQNYTTGKGDLTFSTLNSGTLTEGARLNSSGNFGVGSTTPYLPLGVSKTVSTPQFAIGYDSAHDAEFRVDSSGGLNVAASAGNTYWNNDNVWVCTGGSITTNGCPSGSPSGFGNIIAESRIGIGTSTLGTSNAANAFTIDLNNDTTSNLLNIGTSTSGYGTFTSRLKIDSAGRLLVATTSAPVEANFGGRIFVGAGSTAALTLGTATSTFNGDIKILGKLDVGTIDPVYTIDGTKYATYGASQIGVHEETLQTIELTDKDPSTGKYVYTINFDTLDEAGNFWLFYQITDFGDRWKNLVVSLTPSFDGSVFYKKVPEQHRLLIMADQPGEVSMRLSANRFDWSKWPMLRPDQEDKSYKGFQLSVKPTVSEAASAAVAQ